MIDPIIIRIVFGEGVTSFYFEDRAQAEYAANWHGLPISNNQRCCRVDVLHSRPFYQDEVNKIFFEWKKKGKRQSGKM